MVPMIQVVEGWRAAPAPSQGDEGVAGQGSDLQQDVEVEEVARDHDAHEAGHEEEIEGIEGPTLFGKSLSTRFAGGDQVDEGRRRRPPPAPAVESGPRAYAMPQGGVPIRPAGTGSGLARGHRTRDAQRSRPGARRAPARASGKTELLSDPADAADEQRRRERNDDDQDGQVLAVHCPLICVEDFVFFQGLVLLVDLNAPGPGPRPGWPRTPRWPSA